MAAALQLLTSAAAWQTLHDYWDMDGEEAGETAALAIELLLAGARARAAVAHATIADPSVAGDDRATPPSP